RSNVSVDGDSRSTSAPRSRTIASWCCRKKSRTSTDIFSPVAAAPSSHRRPAPHLLELIEVRPLHWTQVFLHRRHMVGGHIDQCDVVAGSRHIGAYGAADGSGPNHGDFHALVSSARPLPRLAPVTRAIRPVILPSVAIARSG